MRKPYWILAAVMLLGAGCAMSTVTPDTNVAVTNTPPMNSNQPVPPATPGAGGPSGGAAGGTVLTDSEKSNCGITAAVTEGPYYVSGTSALKDGQLNYTSLPGTPLKVSGTVYEGTDNTKPIKDAVIEIWQADNDGSYHPNNNGDASSYAPKDLALRGTVNADADGHYSFQTIYPGEYSGRTRHIHIKVNAPGFQPLTTQLIVPSLAGDSITFDEDTLSQGLPSCHLLEINHDDAPASATFDFRLAK